MDTHMRTRAYTHLEGDHRLPPFKSLMLPGPRALSRKLLKSMPSWPYIRGLIAGEGNARPASVAQMSTTA
eukprot:1157775-Pelagomonas_calceolata.AAC.19